MDPTDTNEISEQFEGSPPGNQQEELNHSDKLIGVISEPGITFSRMAKFPPSALDWTIPLIAFIIIAIVSNFVLFQNPEIKLQFDKMIEEKLNKIEEQMDESIKEGKLTEADKEERMDQTRKGMEFMTGPTMRSVTLVVWTFIGFFLMALIYFLLAKFALKGEGTYSGAMVARGLPVYILFIQIIVIAILSLVLEKLMIDSSLAAILDTDRETIAGYLLSRVDPFAIWFYSVIGIGLAKMFKSDSTVKYIVMVFAVWIIGDLLLYLLGMSFG